MANAGKTSTSAKWIVGLDLGARSIGAIRFAKWLSEAGGDQLVAVHVLEEAHLQAALRYHHLAEVETAAVAGAKAAITAAGADANFQLIDVVEGRTAEESLATAAAYRRADGIVIGRNAAREGAAIVRLGRVARKVLRTLPASVAVVPPDFDPSTAGRGPVVLACSLDDDAIAATAFARGFAERFGRGLDLIHVAASPEDHAAQYVPLATLEKLRKDTTNESEAQLAAWAKTNGLVNAARVVKLGGRVEQIAAHARERDAVAIVTGSRRLSGFERFLLASAGSELAAHASCPVIVVPPARG
jgi:nucleotide-binding universal stress UspA family protein